MRFDLALNSSASAAGARRCGFPGPRQGFAPRDGHSLLYSHVVRLDEGYAGKAKASMLRPLGIEWGWERPRMFIAPHEVQAMDGYLASQGLRPGERLITVSATHKSETRRWFADRYADTFSLPQPGVGPHFYLLYGPGERATLTPSAGPPLRTAAFCQRPASEPAPVGDGHRRRICTWAIVPRRGTWPLRWTRHP